jgi:hypothetical protein
MQTRAATAATLAVLGLLLAGCGTAGSAATTHPGTSPSVAKGMHRMPDGSLMPDSQMSSMPGMGRTSSKPSATAAMICSTEIRHTLQKNLGAATAPRSSTRWADRIYTCTYHLTQGELTASVQDAATVPAGQRFFAAIRARTPGLHKITGLQSLGLPGYADNHGIVLFLKDGKTLQVDATALPAATGRYHQTPAAVAYGLAADILACWSEH